MIRRRDHAWTPFWRHSSGRWAVSVRYTANGEQAVGVAVGRWRLVALWRGLRKQLLPGIG